MSRLQSRAAYKGFDGHIHVTVSVAQQLKVKRLAKKAGQNMSEYMRRVIDDLD